MENTFTNKEKEYIFSRYPETNLRSLQAWNAADEYILEQLEDFEDKLNSIAIYNDRFGFLTCNLHNYLPNVIINFASQKKSILQNLDNNKQEAKKINFVEPLNNAPENLRVAIVKIPKSMELFRMQLAEIANILDEDGVVLCGFMTKYFTKQMLSISNEFFEIVEQSLARKKSRVLVLKNPKVSEQRSILNSIKFEGKTFRQYFGVFSSNNIDYASQFFVKNWKVNSDSKRVLDLASGNGFLGKMIRQQNEDCEINLLDDDYLAVESSKLNFEKDDDNAFFHFEDSLEKFEDNYFDLIVCNPPFHFEFETNIEVAINLFSQVKRGLHEKGSFQLVANRHLNYKTHLVKLFRKVELLKRNKKFEIYDCREPLT